jgi:precorrin-6B methylase 2
MARPYLSGDLRASFDRWLADSSRRCAASLTRPELRKGVRALSSLYVERRRAGALSARALEGRAKRAAIASYFGPLHFLIVHHVLRSLGPESFPGVLRIVDAGAGTGASGAAVALTLPRAPEILGVERSGWMLAEARRTWDAFGLRARVRRGALPAALPRLRGSDLVVLGWVVNELEAREREQVLKRLLLAVRRGTRALMVEPLAERITPWWRSFARRAAELGLREREIRVEIERPEWIRDLDRAAGLDHRRIGGRVLAGPLPESAPQCRDQTSAE